MYLTMSNEGYDARLFRFSPSSKMRSDDETIKGSHQTPQNDELWMIGCLGFSSFCSEVNKTEDRTCAIAQPVFKKYFLTPHTIKKHIIYDLA